MDSVARHYTRPGVLDRVLGALRAQGLDLQNLAASDLAPVDEFHVRGRLATVELAELAGPRSGLHVLDLGSGLGGSTRFLASEFGCLATGVDLTFEYCHAASALSRLVNLHPLTRFCCANALALPFADHSFDLVWTQHVQMNIADKLALYQEIRRVLRPGGRFVFHDILAGPSGPPHFPVHWAEEESISFLIAPGDLRRTLEEAGLRIVHWRDMTRVSAEWFLEGYEKGRNAPPKPLGLHLLLGETAAAKLDNVARNFREERIQVFQGLLERA